MTNQPIIPPPELAEQWARQWKRPTSGPSDLYQYLAAQAAQWGADRELEACVNWSIENQHPRWARAVRAARRPKPPSLKEQALAALHAVATGANDIREQHQDLDTIRQALEQLND